MKDGEMVGGPLDGSSVEPVEAVMEGRITEVRCPTADPFYDHVWICTGRYFGYAGVVKSDERPCEEARRCATRMTVMSH